jgi:hypothetical protein
MIDQDEIRRRQRSRSIIMALLLGAFALLAFLIAMAKITSGQAG